MSLHQLAKQVQSKGRGNDKMLMHVTPREVSGLQAIAKANGGSLSINPNTGLVEAGFLEDIIPSLLPMAAGAALTIGSGGALSPLAASMIVGGGYGLATGSVEQGLMAGLGAYGGAGLAGNLGTAGASSVATEAQTAAQAAEAVNAGVVPQAPPVPGVTPPPQATPIPGADSVSTAFNLPSAPQATPFPSATVSPNAGVYTGDLASFSPAQQQSIIAQRNAVMSTPGIENIMSQPTGGISSGQMLNNVRQGAANTFMPGGEFSMSGTGEFIGNNYGNIGMAAAPTLAASLEPEPFAQPGDNYEEGPYKLKRLSANFQGYTPTRPNPYYRPTGLGYAMGGTVDPMQRMPNGGLAALQSARDGYGSQQTMDGNIPQMAAGRYLKGDGDGMSDDILATINGKQPARLADGEFVVPADVVSHLGNGSSDAGAKKLYAMMDKVRHARTGKKKQAPAVKTDKYLPKFAEGGDVAAPSIADIAGLGAIISGRSAPGVSPMYAPASAGNPNNSAVALAQQLEAARANRPVVDSTRLDSLRGLDSEWELSNDGSPAWANSLLFGGLSSITNPSFSNSNSYRDAQGRVWVKKGTRPSTTSSAEDTYIPAYLSNAGGG
jgi:hypothetical protein